jgi:predicted RNase H-like HicB family nuclease
MRRVDKTGCIATGATRDSVEREMHDAIEFHLDGLRRAGEPIPSPRSEASYWTRLEIFPDFLGS